jgi:hypothetical protein
MLVGQRSLADRAWTLMTSTDDRLQLARTMLRAADAASLIYVPKVPVERPAFPGISGVWLRNVLI